MIYTVTLNPSMDRTMRFPELRIGELNRAHLSRLDVSGKGVNVSLALRVFGLQSVALGFVAGSHGRMVLEALDAQRQAHDFVWVHGETRSNVTVIDESTGVTTKLNEPGPTVAESDLQALQERLLGRLQPGDWCVCSGSLPPGAPDDTYARLIACVKARGAVTALDTSGRPLLLGAEAAPDWLKPNQEEGEALSGIKLDSDAALAASVRRILALGPRRVLLSLGSRGAAYTAATSSPSSPCPAGEEGSGDRLPDASRAAVHLATPPAIREVSAVGAGDAGLAGALWAWSQSLPDEQVARWAVAAGTAATLVDGSAMPTLESIREVYARVGVTQVS